MELLSEIVPFHQKWTLIPDFTYTYVYYKYLYINVDFVFHLKKALPSEC